MSTYKQIRQAMHDNEQAVLQYVKKHGKVEYQKCGMSWMKAIDRLREAKKVKFSKEHGGYIIR